MYVVGVTGGIGSGKSAVSDLFAARRITVVDADVVSRQVVEPGTEALARIGEHFGPGAIRADGTLDRAALRQLIFSNPAEKDWLETLLHPLIAAETWRQLQQATSPYAVYVSPLLVEMKQTGICNRILVIDVLEDLQLQRAMARDNNSEQQIRAIIASQASREQRLAVADDVICNDQDLAALERAVDVLHQRYLELARQAA